MDWVSDDSEQEQELETSYARWFHTQVADERKFMRSPVPYYAFSGIIGLRAKEDYSYGTRALQLLSSMNGVVTHFSHDMNNPIKANEDVNSELTFDGRQAGKQSFLLNDFMRDCHSLPIPSLKTKRFLIMPYLETLIDSFDCRKDPGSFLLKIILDNQQLPEGEEPFLPYGKAECFSCVPA